MFELIILSGVVLASLFIWGAVTLIKGESKPVMQRSASKRMLDFVLLLLIGATVLALKIDSTGVLFAFVCMPVLVPVAVAWVIKTFF